jgi:hypothetical protein
VSRLSFGVASGGLAKQVAADPGQLVGESAGGDLVKPADPSGLEVLSRKNCVDPFLPQPVRSIHSVVIARQPWNRFGPAHSRCDMRLLFDA